MSTGLGAGFGALLLVAVLLGLAALLALVLLAVFVSQARGRAFPRVLRYFAVGILLAVVSTAGFGVAALHDEATVAAGLFLALVFLPVIGAGVVLRQSTDFPLLEVLTVVGMTWSLPFALGVAVFFAVIAGVESAFGLAPVDVQRLHLAWWAVALSGALTTLVTFAFANRVKRALAEFV